MLSKSVKLLERYGALNFGTSGLVASLILPLKPNQFIIRFTYKIKQSLVKFHPLVSEISC